MTGVERRDMTGMRETETGTRSKAAARYLAAAEALGVRLELLPYIIADPRHPLHPELILRLARD